MAPKKSPAPLSRKQGMPAMGSGGDLRDRFRNAYKPNANPPMGSKKKGAAPKGGKKGC